MHMKTGEMYRKTSVQQRSTIVGMLAAGTAANFLLDQRTAAILYTALSTVFTTLFVLFLGARSRWWLTPAGRAEFFAFLSFATLAGWIMVGLTWGVNWGWRNEVRSWLFMGFALATANLFFTLLGVQSREMTDKEFAAETLRREVDSD